MIPVSIWVIAQIVNGSVTSIAEQHQTNASSSICSQSAVLGSPQCMADASSSRLTRTTANPMKNAMTSITSGASALCLSRNALTASNFEPCVAFNWLIVGCCEASEGHEDTVDCNNACRASGTGQVFTTHWSKSFASTGTWLSATYW